MLRDFSAVFAKLLKNQLVGCIYFVSGLNVIYVFTNCTLKTQFYSLFWFGHRLAILTEKVRILKGKSRWADGGNRTHDLVITNDLLYHWATSAFGAGKEICTPVALSGAWSTARCVWLLRHPSGLHWACRVWAETEIRTRDLLFTKQLLYRWAISALV